MRTITITFESGKMFTVAEDDRDTGELAWDEMLGTIAELTHPEIMKARYAMRTDDEWGMWRNRT
jgi:hypothetical protein